MNNPIRLPVPYPAVVHIHTSEIFVTPAPDVPGSFRWGCACGESDTATSAHDLGEQIATHTETCKG